MIHELCAVLGYKSGPNFFSNSFCAPLAQFLTLFHLCLD
jgi:hypothetical protein